MKMRYTAKLNVHTCFPPDSGRQFWPTVHHIRVVRAATGLGLREAKALVDAAQDAGNADRVLSWGLKKAGTVLVILNGDQVAAFSALGSPYVNLTDIRPVEPPPKRHDLSEVSCSTVRVAAGIDWLRAAGLGPRAAKAVVDAAQDTGD